MTDSELFEILVQSYFLMPRGQKLKFGRCIVEINELGYYYDCTQTLLHMVECQKAKKCRAFHFLQNKHFAFDSLIYDGITQTLVLIQITINPNHECHFESIYQFITEKEEPTNENMNKYQIFFMQLSELNLVKSYIFQWMTNKKIVEIEKKTIDFRNKYYIPQPMFEKKMDFQNKADIVQAMIHMEHPQENEKGTIDLQNKTEIQQNLFTIDHDLEIEKKTNEFQKIPQQIFEKENDSEMMILK